MDMNLSKFWKIVMDKGSRSVMSDIGILTNYYIVVSQRKRMPGKRERDGGMASSWSRQHRHFY